VSSRALLLVNPRARRGAEEAGELAAGLRRTGLELVVEPSGDPAVSPDFIRRHAREVDRVVVAGGDGTINHAVLGAETRGRFEVMPRALEVFASEPSA
jgi:diacylglycerol kinase (ATP)